MITVLKPYFLPKRRHSTKSYFIKAIDRASDISRKKSKILRDFQGQIRGKIGRFRGKKVKIRGTIGRFRGIFAGEKSKFAEKSAHFTGF